MVGNDIVDLKDPESAAETLHPRFDTRVFSSPEREQLEYSGDSARERWVLWAAKEAGFKLMKRLRPEVVFSPRRFVVVMPPAAFGRRLGSIDYEGSRMHVSAWQDTEVVHAVARPLADDGWLELQGFRALSPDELACGDPALPSRAARALAIEAFAGEVGIDPEALSVETSARIPRLVHRGRDLAALSLSHHGRFVAFAGACHENQERLAS